MRRSLLHVSIRLAAIALAPSLLVPAAAQESRSSVQGFVVDSVRAFPLPGVLVFLDADRETRTDADGHYRFADIAPGDYILAALTADCRIAAARLTITEPETLEVALRVGSQRLPSAADSRAARAEGTGAKVLTAPEIAALSVNSVPDLLRRVAPTMVGTRSGAVGSRVAVVERGVTTITGSRTPLIFLDGIRIADADILHQLVPETIVRLEVHAGATGGWAHGPGGASGAIRIYTGSGRPDIEREVCGLTEARRR